jgi:GPH family glycoside/pentoside/hexuronide:cation symporter
MRTRDRYAFGLSGLADNLIGTFLGVHLFVYYTDVVGLDALWVSAGLTLALLWNALSDFAMGRLSDRTTLRAGRRRPYLVLGALPLGVAFTLLLSPPERLAGHELGLYFAVTLLFLFSMKTMVQVPALSLIPELARSSEERTRLSAAREQLGNVGDLLGLLLPVAWLIGTGAMDEGAPEGLVRLGFERSAMVIGAVATAAVLGAFFGTREDPSVRPARPASSREVLAAIAAHRPFQALISAAALGALALSFVQSMILYVLHHVMRETAPEVEMAAFVINALSAILSYPLWTRFAARVGKATAFRTGLFASTLAFSSVFFVGPGNYLGLAAVMAFSGVANVGFWTLLHALNADCADLDAARSGQRREGLFSGLAALVKKLAIAGAAAGVGLGLTVIGYEEGVAPSADVVLRLQLLFAIPPTLLALAALAAFRRFDAASEGAAGAPLADRALGLDARP